MLDMNALRREFLEHTRFTAEDFDLITQGIARVYGIPLHALPAVVEAVAAGETPAYNALGFLNWLALLPRVSDTALALVCRTASDVTLDRLRKVVEGSRTTKH